MTPRSHTAVPEERLLIAKRGNASNLLTGPTTLSRRLDRSIKAK